MRRISGCGHVFARRSPGKLRMATAPSHTSTPLSSSCYARFAAQDSGAHIASPVFFSETFARCKRRVIRITTRRATCRATKYGAEKNLLDSRRQSGTMACCRCACGNATQRHAVSEIRGYPPLLAGKPLRNAGQKFASKSGNAEKTTLDELFRCAPPMRDASIRHYRRAMDLRR